MHNLRLASCLFALTVGCGGGSLEVAPEDAAGGPDAATDGSGADGGADTGAPADGGADTGTPPVDTGVPPVDAGPPTCIAPTADSTNLYVDGAVPTTGKGDAGCPFKTIVEAASFALTPGVKRTIHVKTGTYDEKDAVRLESGVILQSEGGRVTLSGGSTAPCAPAPERCVLTMKAGSTLDGFDVDAKSVGIGVLGIAGTPSIRNTAVRNSQHDGAVFPAGAELGPNVHFDENTNAGVIMRGGKLHVIGTSNSFDSNKGKGVWAGSTYIAGGGVLLYGAELDFEGGSASNNASGGVAWDWSTPAPATTQKVSNLVAKGNQGGGLTLLSQSNLVLRKSTLTKNGSYGLWLGYNSAISNVYDLGTTTGAGGNVFGGGSDKNGKVGIFLCRPGKTGSQPAEGDSFATCGPSQAMVSNCDSMPGSYADIGYVPNSGVGTTAGVNPVSATVCTVGP